jgi:hypothetical protein
MTEDNDLKSKLKCIKTGLEAEMSNQQADLSGMVPSRRKVARRSEGMAS